MNPNFSSITMRFGTYLTGPFGQSQQLYEARNEEKRQRADKKTTEQQRQKDTIDIITLQQQAGLDYIIDPGFYHDDIFETLIRNIPGIATKRQENWFNNNTFYNVPQITAPLNKQTEFSTKHTHLLPKEKTMAILPSPYTILTLSDVHGYPDQLSAITDIAQLIDHEARTLATKGITRIQYDEPAFVYKNSHSALMPEDYKLLDYALNLCGQIPNATTSLHTYFGTAEGLMDYFEDLYVDCIGIDLTETRPETLKPIKKEITIGMIDARTTARENPQNLAKLAKEIAQHTQAETIWITPNTGTDQIGYTATKEVINLLRKTKEALT